MSDEPFELLTALSGLAFGPGPLVFERELVPLKPPASILTDEGLVVLRVRQFDRVVGYVVCQSSEERYRAAQAWVYRSIDARIALERGPKPPPPPAPLSIVLVRALSSWIASVCVS